MSDASSGSGSGDGAGLWEGAELDPAHELLLAVMWVFLGLACTGTHSGQWIVTQPTHTLIFSHKFCSQLLHMRYTRMAP